LALIVSGERRLEYADLHDRSARAARGLQDLGVGVGDAVALFLRNDIAFLEAGLAAGLLGAYPVAMNWHSTAAEAGYILGDSGAKVLVVHADLLPRIRPGIPPGVEILVVETPPEVAGAYGLNVAAREPRSELDWDAWLQGCAPLDGPVARAPETMIYTSGTTGRPKGVRRSAATEVQAAQVADITAASYGISGRERPLVALISAPLYHAAPNVQAQTALRVGASVVLQPRFEAEETLRLIARWRVTHAYFPPILFKRLLQLPESVRRRHDLSSLEFVAHAAAPCPPDIKRAMIAWWGPVIHEFYGTTETRAITVCDTQEWLERPGTVGRAMPSASVRVLDAEGRDAPPGVLGEVVGAHPAGADFTYHGDQTKRRAADRGGLIATGDIGYLDEAGYLFICDRRTDMIISGGVNIYPAEIEAELAHAPGVLDCAVFGVPDEEYGEAVMAVVQSTDGRPLDPDALRRHLSERLSGFKVPRTIEQLDQLPREESGKIFKRRLRDRYWENSNRRI
jgi:long-chain acyl-CoA synthetase